MGDGLEGNFWEEALPLCVQSRFECLHGCSGHNILWQLVPIWDYSDAERMLATTSLTTLLVNLQSMPSKPNAGGGSKYRVTWKVENLLHWVIISSNINKTIKSTGLQHQQVKNSHNLHHIFNLQNLIRILSFFNLK